LCYEWIVTGHVEQSCCLALHQVRPLEQGSSKLKLTLDYFLEKGVLISGLPCSWENFKQYFSNPLESSNCKWWSEQAPKKNSSFIELCKVKANEWQSEIHLSSSFAKWKFVMHGNQDENKRCQIYSLNPKSCMMRTVISARRLVKEIIAVIQSHMYWLLFSLLPQLIQWLWCWYEEFRDVWT
jgi:hypothetical protein